MGGQRGGCSAKLAGGCLFLSGNWSDNKKLKTGIFVCEWQLRTHTTYSPGPMTTWKFLLDITAKVGTENMFSQKLWNSNLQDTNNYHGIK